MFEVQSDQHAEVVYEFKDDNQELTDVNSIDVVSSNPEFLEVVQQEKTETGKYPYRFNWVGEGVGTVNLEAKRLANDTNPITDVEAFSTIPNVAEGVSKTINIIED